MQGFIFPIIKNKYNKMNKQEIYEQLKQLWEEFEKNHNATSKVSD